MCHNGSLIWCAFTWGFDLMLGYLWAPNYKLPSWYWSNQHFLGPPIPYKTAEFKHPSFYKDIRALKYLFLIQGCNFNAAKKSSKSLKNKWCNNLCNFLFSSLIFFKYSLHFVKLCSTYTRQLHSLSLDYSPVIPKSMSFFVLMKASWIVKAKIFKICFL